MCQGYIHVSRLRTKYNIDSRKTLLLKLLHVLHFSLHSYLWHGHETEFEYLIKECLGGRHGNTRLWNMIFI